MKRSHRRLKQGVSGIVAATILCGILFGTGTMYFLTIIRENQSYQAAAVARSQMDLESSSEQFKVTGALVSNQYIGAIVNNTGPTSITMAAIIITDFSDNVLEVLTTTPLPQVVNGGSDSPPIGTSVVNTGLQYKIKAFTSRGNVGIGYYPPEQEMFYANTSMGFGALSFDFTSYRYYTLSGGVPKQLNPYPVGISAYTVPMSTDVAFSVKITNADPQKRTIVFDQYTFMWQYHEGSRNYRSWYLVRVQSNGQALPYNTPYITIPYGASEVLFFMATLPGGTTPTTTPNQPGIALVFLVFHGTIGGSPWGQNIPFVSTLYQ